MDVFAHFFWTFILFYSINNFRYALLISVMPDILSWGIYSGYTIWNDVHWGRPNLSNIPEWTFTLYGITHSIIVIALVFTIIYFWKKRIPTFLYVWPLQVIIDIPLHSREFLPTPFLWPLSEWKFPGISWGNEYFMFINYILITILLALTLIYRKNILLTVISKLKNKFKLKKVTK